MSSKRFTDKQLEEQLQRRADRLPKMIKERFPALFVAEEIGMIVASARLLYGKERVDEQIDRQWKMAEAIDAGLCFSCSGPETEGGPGSCRTCEEKAEKEAAEAGIYDDFPASNHIN